MDNDLHVNLPGELALVLDETLEYIKLFNSFNPFICLNVSNTAVILSTAILFYRDFWKENCEYYGYEPVKEDK